MNVIDKGTRACEPQTFGWEIQSSGNAEAIVGGVRRILTGRKQIIGQTKQPLACVPDDPGAVPALDGVNLGGGGGGGVGKRDAKVLAVGFGVNMFEDAVGKLPLPDEDFFEGKF
jgi:hypothetical protein